MNTINFCSASSERRSHGVLHGGVISSVLDATGVRMELHNDIEKLIAVGTGTYVVG